jgi:hypothetical protein
MDYIILKIYIFWGVFTHMFLLFDFLPFIKSGGEPSFPAKANKAPTSGSFQYRIATAMAAHVHLFYKSWVYHCRIAINLSTRK